MRRWEALKTLKRVIPETKRNATLQRKIVSLQFLQEWITFKDGVLEACRSLDLSQAAPITDDATENFVIGSERGLTGRFVKHFCDPVIKVLATTQLSNLTFGDYHAADPSDASRNVPDVVMLMLPESKGYGSRETEDLLDRTA
ncbi:hypothetical protein ETB97_008516 [Aspergillus alliaceus]|uniref:Uncharacterized protein n=1 Tax=Petromyces alliaceus TaxID=209559 RepID=A0A8H6AD59_PETAA|nr:hypothetical protein ETB97_008516 [Aspergillus burnettii]